MPLAANALVSLETAKAFLNLSGSVDDPAVEVAINRASDRCERYCGRRLVRATYANRRYVAPLGRDLYLGDVPVDTSAPVTVSVNGVAQTVWRSEADGDPANADVIVAPDPQETRLAPYKLVRPGGWLVSTRHPYTVVVSYTGGFSQIPEDLQLACLYVIQRYWRDQQKQLADVTTVTLPSGSVTLLDVVLPREARAILDAYRATVLA